MISNRFHRGLLGLLAIAVCVSFGVPSSHAQEMKKPLPGEPMLFNVDPKQSFSRLR